MKKIKLLLLLAILVPAYVKADMGGPMMIPYEMIVTNPDGKDCSNYDNTKTYHIDKDAKFTVNFESTDRYYITYNEDNCELTSLDGAVLVKEEIDPVKEYKEDGSGLSVKKLDKAKSVLVYAENGVDVQKGPASAYSKVGKLEKGKKLTYQYYTDSYVYIEDGTLKGWIDTLEIKVLIENSTQYITMTDMKLSCGTIPKNTIVVPAYNSDAWSHKSLIEYQGCKDLVENRFGTKEMTMINSTKEHSKAELTIYEFYGNEGKELAKIPTDTDFIIYAQNGIQGDETVNIYVEYNDTKGWVKTTYSNYSYVEDLDKELEPTTTEEEPTEVDPEPTPAPKAENPYEFAIKWGVIGLTVVLAAIVIIVLINKNKHKNEE